MKLNENSIYFKSLTVEKLKCFKAKHKFNFSDKNGKPAQWTVILGNNGTGKTTILRALAGLVPTYVDLEELGLKLESVEKLRLSDSFIDRKRIPRPVTYYQNRFNDSETVSSFIFIKRKVREWGYSGFSIYLPSNEPNKAELSNLDELENLKIYGYGIKRKSSKKSLSDIKDNDTTLSLFDENVELTNVEEWLLQLDYSIKNKSKVAEKRLAKVKEILTSEILPNINDFKFITDENLKNFVLFKIDNEWIRFEELGYGYQVTIAWLIDLMKKMFERYPKSENPLHESAIVLVDEIDLHLHPEWQRKIIKFVGNIFPNTQFVVTTHSPLVVQSADEINVIVLQKNGDNISVKQSEFTTFKAWSVEEILSELMELGERTKSEDYLRLIKEFDEALDNNDKEQAEKAYQELDEILPPLTHHRKLLKIQMTSLTSDND